MPLAVRRRRDHLADLVDELELRAELECITLDHLAGVTPPGMRRALFDHELDAQVNFAELVGTVDARAQGIAERLAADRAKFAELLHQDLAHAISTSPLAADQAVAGRLADLLDPSRFADPIAGTAELVTAAEQFHSAELAHSVQEGMARAVSEARAQGIPAAHLPRLGEGPQARLDTLSRRLAAQPHADVITAARNAADQVAGTGLAGEHVLARVDGAVESLSAGPLDNYARPAAQQAHNLGHQEAAAAAPGHVTIYASELLDSNTCGPCSLIDGNQYDTEEEALADYPGGTYVDCEGGDRCRGTLVYVWEAEAPPSTSSPGDEPAPPEPPAPYPFGTSRALPGAAPLEPPPPSPLPVQVDHLPTPEPITPTVELPPPAPGPSPAPDQPPAPPVAGPPTTAPADVPPLDLPETPAEAPYSAEELAAARRHLPAARAEVRRLAADQRAEVLAQLDRADAMKLQAPPPARAVRGPNGAIEYRREGQGWDWFDTLHPDEQKRLRRDGFWMTSEHQGGIVPDELAGNWASRFGREVSTEQAAMEWVDLTRQADALSTLSRGRLINLQPYGGLDVNTLVDSPYDLRLLFDDPEVAAAHVAGVTQDLAEQMADRSFPPTRLGPQPYELTLDEFVAEVTRLEEAQAAIIPPADEWGDLTPADQAIEDRLRELIPNGLEDRDHPLGLDELHDLIQSLARKAGRL